MGFRNLQEKLEKQVEKLLISFPKGQIQHFYVKTRRAPMLLLKGIDISNCIFLKRGRQFFSLSIQIRQEKQARQALLYVINFL